MGELNKVVETDTCLIEIPMELYEEIKKTHPNPEGVCCQIVENFIKNHPDSLR